MPHIDRFSESLDTELLAAFDHYIADKGYETRSEAVRDLIRDALAKGRPCHDDDVVVTTLNFVMEPGAGDTAERLHACLLRKSDLIRGSSRWPIDEKRESVTIVLFGRAGQVHALTDSIQSLRGVTNTRLATTTIATGDQSHHVSSIASV